ncbi:hypothetical protein Bca101_044204 [Brassica carinata]
MIIAGSKWHEEDIVNDILTVHVAKPPLSLVESAAESLFHISIDISNAPDLVASYTRPGQYLQLRVPDVEKPSFLAIASPPSFVAASGAFEFLVKSIAGSTAEILCGLKKGETVELSPVMGNGFEVEQIDPPEEYPTVLIFATGSGISSVSAMDLYTRLLCSGLPATVLAWNVINLSCAYLCSPIRSLIETGFGADRRSDVRLYYGARNLKRMAYQEKFKEWESSGVKVVPVLSQPDDGWRGETGYVQAAFARAKQVSDPSDTGVVLCGQRQMAEEITAMLVADGVSNEKMLKNF